MTTNKPYSYLDNNLAFSIAAAYPEDTKPVENQEALIQEAQARLLWQLALYVIPAADSRLTFVALCYASGMDISYFLPDTNPTESAIAKRFGVSKHQFSWLVKKVREDFPNLQHSSTTDDRTTEEPNKFRQPTQKDNI